MNTKVRVAALEVYERRALISYDIEGLLHEQIDDDISAVMFKFRLPEAHPNSPFTQGAANHNLHTTLMYRYIHANEWLDTVFTNDKFDRLVLSCSSL